MTNYAERDVAARAILESDDSALAQLIVSNGDPADLLERHTPTEDLIAEVRDCFSDLPISMCERCDCDVHEEDTQLVDGDNVWCDDCVSNAAYYWEDDGEYHSEPEREDCSDSFGGYHGESRNSAKPGDIGLEVELQFHDDASDVNDHAEQAGLIMEQDSSLNYSNSGEAITHPFTPDRKGMKELGGLTQFLDAVRASGWSNTGYGIHVNVDRRGISRYVLARVERFMSRNVDDVYRIAGRQSSQWSPVLNRSTYELGKETQKYAALRIASDRVEFRIFQSNARAKGVRHCASFALDLISYCRDAGWDGLEWSSFCEAYPQWADFRTKSDAVVV